MKYIQKRLNEATERLEQLEKLYPEKMACVAIREEVEEKNKKIETTEDTLQTLKSQIKKDEKDLEIVANESMACNSIRESVLVLDNLQKECKVIERSVQDLEKKIGESGGLSDRSYEEVKTEEDLKTQGKFHTFVDHELDQKFRLVSGTVEGSQI